MATTGDENVEQAVIVEVEEGDPAAERLDDGEVPGLLAVAVRERDAAGGGRVGERRRAGRFLLRLRRRGPRGSRSRSGRDE